MTTHHGFGEGIYPLILSITFHKVKSSRKDHNRK